MIVKLIAEGPSLIYRTIMATLVEATGSPQVKIAVMGDSLLFPALEDLEESCNNHFPGGGGVGKSNLSMR